MNEATTVTGTDYLFALELHLEAHEVYFWLKDLVRTDFRTPAGNRFDHDAVARRREHCKRVARQRGWSWQQVTEYVASPEKPRPLGGEGKRRRFEDIGDSDPEQTVRNIFHRLRATQPKPQEPSPERKRELLQELRRSIMPIGSEFRHRDAYEIAERASIMADEPVPGVRTEVLAVDGERNPFEG